MKFRAEVEQGSTKNVTGIEVPAKIVEALGAGKRPPVKVTINGYTYRNTIAVMDGAYMFSVSAEVREKAGVKGGDKVDVDIELDTEPREVTVPPDLSKALARDKKAKAFFEGLSYSNKRRLVLNIEGAKAAETRERRVAKTVAQLAEGKV